LRKPENAAILKEISKNFGFSEVFLPKWREVRKTGG
jgi:hypothetical protein